MDRYKVLYQSTSILKYHINTKHTSVGDPDYTLTNTLSSLQQTILTERQGLSKSTSGSLTDTVVKWIATNCRPINIINTISAQALQRFCKLPLKTHAVQGFIKKHNIFC